MRKSLITLASAAAIAALFFLRPFSPRWVLAMLPLDHQVHIQVSLSSEERQRFETTIPIADRTANPWLSKPTSVTLKNKRTTLPAGKILFADTTHLPGAFEIQIESHTLRIQESGISVETAALDRK